VPGEWILINDQFRIRPFKESYYSCLLCGWSTVFDAKALANMIAGADDPWKHDCPFTQESSSGRA